MDRPLFSRCFRLSTSIAQSWRLRLVPVPQPPRLSSRHPPPQRGSNIRLEPWTAQGIVAVRRGANLLNRSRIKSGAEKFAVGGLPRLGVVTQSGLGNKSNLTPLITPLTLLAMNRCVLVCLALLFSSLSQASGGYGYPIDNPLAATVIGTPAEYAAELPRHIRREEMQVVVYPDRKIPEFIPRTTLNYALVTQKQEAPLIFSIAGTGASYRSAKMRLLEKVFYQAGFHVVSLSSPTYANFIVTASSTRMPGHLVKDSEDLYRVMETIYAQIHDKVKVSKFYLTGYSLGGAQAAFIAKLDEERKSFNFEKVLMINPPVSLFSSVSILDNMLEDNIPGGRNNFAAFFDEIMSEVTKAYTKLEHVDFNDNFLYRIYENKHEKINPKRVSALIGLSFRISSSNMIFTSDYLTNGGYILPKNHRLRRTESTTGYFEVAMRTTFIDYFHERFYPFFHAQQPDLTEKALIYDTSLESIADYLGSAKKIAVVHNEDDIILAPGQINFFRTVFGARAHIYPRGGHCGNMAYKDNVKYMVDFFTDREVQP